MKRFNNILFVSSGIGSNANVLRQALFFVTMNKANIDILILYPVLPDSFADYKDTYEEMLLSNMRKSVKQVIEDVGLNSEEVNQYLSYSIESCETPVVRIVQHVLRSQYDLVFKKSEPHDGEGLKAIDMGLMRKCPCPVWIYSTQQDTTKIKHIAVAIDPESPEIAGADLAEHLLKLSNDLSAQMNAKLSVISCWSYAYEDTIRTSDFAAVPQEALNKIIEDAKDVHFATLKTIINSANIGENFDLQHLKGMPSKIIPDFVNQHNVDLLIMGTVARTGIPGFLMGNTAEDIVRKISCTVLALKPVGFVTPIKPF